MTIPPISVILLRRLVSGRPVAGWLILENFGGSCEVLRQNRRLPSRRRHSIRDHAGKRSSHQWRRFGFALLGSFSAQSRCSLCLLRDRQRFQRCLGRIPVEAALESHPSGRHRRTEAGTRRCECGRGWTTAPDLIRLWSIENDRNPSNCSFVTRSAPAAEAPPRHSRMTWPGLHGEVRFCFILVFLLSF